MSLPVGIWFRSTDDWTGAKDGKFRLAYLKKPLRPDLDNSREQPRVSRGQSQASGLKPARFKPDTQLRLD